MSRLDYITIAIVAACILAIVFLVYKMTDLFHAENGEEQIENATGDVELEDDGVYNYDLDEAEPASDLEEVPAAADTDDGTEDFGVTTSPAREENVPPPVINERDLASDGKFMVIAGAFTKRYLADQQAKRLRGLGYTDAAVKIFDRGKYAVILVDRYSNMADAERLVRQLENDGIDSYIKLQEQQ